MKKISLQTTMIAAFLVFVAIPMLVTSLLLGSAYKSTLHGNYANQVEASMAQVQAGIDDEIKRMSLALSVVANDKELMRLLERWSREQNTSERFSIARQIDRQLNAIVSYNADVNGLVVFFKNGRYYYFRNDLSQPTAKIRKLPWYKDAKRHRGFVDVFGNNGDYLAMQTKAKSWDAIISPKAITLDNQVEGIYMNMHSPVLNSLDRMGATVNNRSVQIVASEVVVADDPGYYTLRKPLNHDKWTLVFSEPLDQLTQDIKGLLANFYAIYLIVALSFSIYIVVFYRASIRPIRQLVQRMRDVEAGNLQVTSDVAGPKEIKKLNASFNEMMANINTLISELNQKEKERSLEELRALQAQINPHFIYNTLNTIKLMAMMTKAESIQQMLDAFMKVIELTYKSEGTLLTLKEEMAYIEAYVHIMKARYGSFFEFSYTLAPEVSDCRLMKMLLQPFVENAVVHGLQYQQDGHIEIRAYAAGGEANDAMANEVSRENDCLVIEITDNGIGMEPGQIAELLQPVGHAYHQADNQQQADNQHHLNHIGIANVKRRIELTYGAPYTVTIDSVVDTYTKVVVTLPMLRSEENPHV